jgi:tryptophan synthase alpha subunit
VREVQTLAEAAVVGSAVVHAIEGRYRTGGAAVIEALVRELKKGTGSKTA